jgi:hypothetical protein
MPRALEMKLINTPITLITVIRNYNLSTERKPEDIKLKDRMKILEVKPLNK